MSSSDKHTGGDRASNCQRGDSCAASAGNGAGKDINDAFSMVVLQPQSRMLLIVLAQLLNTTHLHLS